MLSMGAQSLLRSVRASIGEGHWIKGRAHDNQGNYCLSGHLTVSRNSTNYRDYAQAHKAVCNVIRARGFQSIPHFNDARRTTKDDVLAVIDEAMRGEEPNGAVHEAAASDAVRG